MATGCDDLPTILRKLKTGEKIDWTPGPPSTTVPPPPPPTTAPPTVPPTTAPGGNPALTASMIVNKLTFGPKPGLVAAVTAMGVNNWLEQQLTRSGLGTAESRLASGYPTLSNSNMANYTVQDSDGGQDRLFDQMDHANIQRAVYSDQQLFEVMCDFWGNHFNIWRRHTWMGFLRTRDYEDVVRGNAMGKFSTMLLASAQSPSMLDYLDNLPNDASTPGGVNQNYARELLELHSLGIINGVQAYTEADVQAVAQIISGFALEWGNVATKYDFKFLPWQHSRTAVSCFGGAVSFPARAYGQGYDDGITLVNYLAHHPATARYVCWKLIKRFVTDTPSMALVDSAAAVFAANDTAIVPTLRHIFASAEFAASAGQKIRRPFEHLVACLRATNATMGTAPQGNSANGLRWSLESMGQPIFERVTPDGYPDHQAFWVSSDGLLNRWEAAGNICRNAMGDQSDTADRVRVDLLSLMPNPLPATVNELIAWMAVSLGNYVISAQDIADMCTALGITGTAVATTVTTNAGRLSLTVGLVLSHPSFQRR